MGLPVLILIGLLQVSSNQACNNLEVFNGNQKITVNCTEHGTANCSNGPSHQSFPPYLAAGASVAKPRDFQAIQYRGNLSAGNTIYEVSGMRYEWKVPVDGTSRQHLKGFYLRMQPVGSGNVICRLLDLRDFDMTTSAAYSFTYTLYPFNTFGTYIVELFSLPPPSRDEYEQGLYERYIVAIQKYRDLNTVVYPVDWSTWVTVQPYPTESTIKVSFGFPAAGSLADRANFTKYLIQLVEGATVVKRHEYIRTMYSGSAAVYNFTNVPSGTYLVQVVPQDILYTDPNNCQCWKRNPSGFRECEPCKATETKSFNFTSVTITSTTTTTTTMKPASNPGPTVPPKVTDTSKASDQQSTLAHGASTSRETPSENSGMIAVYVLVPLSVVVVAITAFCWCRHRRVAAGKTGKGGKLDRNENNVNGRSGIYKILDIPIPGMTKELKVPEISRKTVVLLASEDHKYFSQALHNFSTFLKLHCQCDVMFASEQLDDVRKTANSYCWLSGKIDKADFVIVVNSEAACRLYQAFQNGQVYKEADLGPEGDLFTPGIKHICGKITRGEDVSKVIMVSFEHTSDKHRLPISALPPSFYPLPSRLKSFLFHIHGLDDKTMNLSKVNLPLQGNEGQLEGGAEWLSAVSKSVEFERDNPGWFQAKFGRPVDMSDKEKPLYDTQVSGLSEESGFFEGRNSGIFPRRLSSVSTHAEEQRDMYVPDGLENPSFVFSKSDFFAPSEFEAKSAYTVPYSAFTAAESPPEVDQGSIISDEFRMMNERYEQDRLQELYQQQGPESIPQEERSAISDQTGYPQAYQNLAYPRHDAYYIEIQRCESEKDLDCISVSSAQSV